MSIGLFARLVCAASLFLATVTNASAQSAPLFPDYKPQEPNSRLIGSGGEYTESFELDLPEFRGLVPDLKLIYNSNNTTRGGAENFVAVGWQLAGLSSIERKSVGGGVPTFDIGQDIYLLDGQELMACEDAASTSKWSSLGQVYPLRYKTTAASASCSSGGNFSTRIESYRKIYYNLTTNEFSVTDPDGRRYRYQSARAIAGDTSPWGSAAHSLGSNHWYLTEITDSQKDLSGNYTNKVTIDYYPGTAASGFFTAPRTISYGGYTLSFLYITTTQPFTTFGTGTSIMGAGYAQLGGITVSDGATKIRAYRLTQGASALSGASLLRKVETLGSDFVAGTGIITSGAGILTAGTKLSEVSYEYSADTYNLTQRTYPGTAFHKGAFSYDWDNTNFDQLFLFGGPLYNGSTFVTNLAAARYGFDTAGNITTLPTITNTCPDLYTNPPPGYNTAVPPRLLSDARNGTTHFCAGMNRNATSFYVRAVETGAQTYDVGYSLYKPGAFNVGNYDLDADTEILFNNTIFHFVGGYLTAFQDIGQPFDQAYLSPDLNGDGTTEATFPSSNAAWRLAPEDGYVGTTIVGKWLRTWATSFIGTANTIGDFNGDGLNDLAIYNSTGNDFIDVWLNTGRGFTGSTRWTFTDILPTGAVGGRLEDVNSDGAADLIVSSSVTGANTYSSTALFLNLGGQFVFQRMIAGPPVTGDFDGNGMADFVLGGTPGAILFNLGPVPNRLVAVNRASGGRTEVTYAPSTDLSVHSGVSGMPMVQQLVKAVTEKDGRGNSRATSYFYSNAHYDFINRKALGYNVVTAQQDPIAGETVGPVITTFYKNSNFVEAGLVTTQMVTVNGNATWSRLDNDWTITGPNGLTWSQAADVAPESGGPFKISKSREWSAVWQGDQLVETTRQFTYTPYGAVAQVDDLGFSTGGTDIASGDNLTEVYGYAPNLSAYLVNLPVSKQTRAGATVLHETQYVYDNLGSWGATPLVGNLTNVWDWDGVNAANGQRETARMSYDANGNVLSERDAGGNVTTHAYDAAKTLFRISSTNALGQAQLTGWNTACQRPATQTDANGLVTSFTYDLFCRETRQDLPSGQYQKTSYVNIGNPTSQYVEKESLSPSTVVGSDKRISREYFDGLGQVYLAASTATTSDITQGVAELRAYDKRGNLDWKSIPLTWAAAQTGTTTAAQRTSILYDPINRPVQTLYADGTYDTTSYTHKTTTRYGAAVEAPATRSNDAHCFDSVAANTICGDSLTIADNAGRVIQTELQDTALTDVGSTTPTRSTVYNYDALGRMSGITDPAGLQFSYGYDIYGNRTQVTDPGLGTWTMTYDLNGNLLSQTDAKGQLITFTYDALNRVTLKTVGTGPTRIETRYTYDEVRAGYYNKGRLTTQAVTDAGAVNVVHTIQSDYHTSGAVQQTRQIYAGRTYTFTNTLRADGSVQDMSLPNKPDGSTNAALGAFTYDASGRLASWTGYVTSASYDLWGNRTAISYANGTAEAASFSPTRGWLNQIAGTEAGGAQMYLASYSRSATGRIIATDTGFTSGATVVDAGGALGFTYDYAGRLIAATNSRGVTAMDQTFSYDAAGRMRTNSQVGTYAYANPTVARHAPSTITNAAAQVTTLTYDGNGNMTAGLSGQVMSYDAENRPATVVKAGARTCYYYGADGSRIKQIDGFATNQACTTAPSSTQTVTVWLGPIEIRRFQQGASLEKLILYPTPDNRIIKYLSGSTLIVEKSTLHRDGLGSIRAVTSSAGLRTETDIYRPFGEQTETTQNLGAISERKGYIGERYDAATGLQYLNARYYDPKLGMFLQPDWWDPTKPGVGTNRYSYAFGDPINSKDPSGHAWYNDWNDFKDLFRSKDTVDPCTGRRTIESAPVLRAVVPGQVAWDNLRTYAVNGEYTNAAISGAAMAGEIALAVSSGGLGKAGTAATETFEVGVATASKVTTAKRGSQVLQNRAVHNAAVDARVAQLESQGYKVTREVTFSADGKVARIDLVASKNGKVAFAEDIKTGSAPSYSRNQESVFGAVSNGTATPRGFKAEVAGLEVGEPLSRTLGGGIPHSVIRINAQ